MRNMKIVADSSANLMELKTVAFDAAPMQRMSSVLQLPAVCPAAIMRPALPRKCMKLTIPADGSL